VQFLLAIFAAVIVHPERSQEVYDPSCVLNNKQLQSIEIPCQQTVPPVEETPVIVHPERSQEVYDPSCVLNNKQLQSIVESNEIRAYLGDANLQKLIQKIDSSKDPENEWSKAMEGQMFRQFTDTILSVVTPREDAL